MGFNVLEIGDEIRKMITISVKACYRSVCSHPFLVGMVSFAILLYISCPFVFSLLVYVSPVLVCTAVLLGTLLSFGESNIPEIETEEKKTLHIAALKAGVSEDTVVVPRDEGFAIDRYMGKGRDIVERVNEEASSAESKVSKVDKDKDDSLDRSILLTVVTPREREIQCETRVVDESDEEFHDTEEVQHKIEIHKIRRNESDYSDGEVVGSPYSLIPKVEDDNFIVENDKLLDGHIGDPLGSSQDLYWKQRDDNDDSENDNVASDSGSDGAESSSPDASMADIMPLLDELHPLLDSDAPQPVHLSHDDSDAASERSQSCNDGSAESDVDTENQDEEEGEDDEEEEVQEDQEVGVKSAITWTEDDEKNLMDLGTSEMERNQRLENLIARRRARKNMRLMAEKNLIDLESAELPLNISPISTTRQNPFDIPYDSYGDTELPPIPGSAPSILLPRRNPFDIPYDSTEEKPNLTGDSFQQEYMTFHQKDTFFRRHESFSLGPSGLGGHRQEKQDIKWRPFFVPERLASEGISYPSLQRQSSENSESKMSSAPETESMCSAADQEDKELAEDDVFEEMGLISNIGHVSDCGEHGSQSSEDVESLEVEQIETRDVDFSNVEIKRVLENHQKKETDLIEMGVVSPVESIGSKNHLNSETVKEDITRLSLSSLSKVDGEIVDVKKDQGSTSLGPSGNLRKEPSIPAPTSMGPRGDLRKESGILTQSLADESNIIRTSGMVDDNLNQEPVYDSSPPAGEKYISFSSISSDLQVEVSEVSLSSVTVETNIPFIDKEFKVLNNGTEKVTPGNDEMLAAPSQPPAVDHMELKAKEVNKIGENDVIKFYDPKGSPFSLGKQLPLSEKSLSGPYFDDHKEPLESSSIVAESIPSEDLDHRPSLDKGFLSELDIVGDFSVRGTGSKLNETEKHLGADGGKLLVPHNEEKIEKPVAESHHADSVPSKTEKSSLILAESIPSSDPEHRSSIDKEFLSELDIIGDFSVNTTGSKLNETEKHLGTDGGNLSVEHKEEKIEKPVAGSLHANPASAKTEEKLEKLVDPIPSKTEVKIEKPTEPVLAKTEVKIEKPAEPVLAKTELKIEKPAEPVVAKTEVKIDKPAEPVLAKTEVKTEKPADPVPAKTEVKIEKPAEPVPAKTELETKKPAEPLPAKTEAEIEKPAEPLPAKTEAKIEKPTEPVPAKTEGKTGKPADLFPANSGVKMEEPLAGESFNADQVPAKTEVGCNGFGFSTKDSNLTETKLESPVLEEKSVENIDKVVVESKDEVRTEKIEGNEVNLSKVIKSTSEESNVKGTCISATEKSEKVKASEPGSSKEIKSSSEESHGKDNISAAEKTKQVIQSSSEESHVKGTNTGAAAENPTGNSEGDLDKLPKSLDSNEKSAKVEANEASCSKEIK